jgi:TrmH family RNA methyltransferase
MNTLEIISSSQNTQIKLLGKLGQKKYRQQLGQFMVENLAIIHDALTGGHDFKSIFVTQEFIASRPEKFAYLQAHSACAQWYVVDQKLNKQYSQLETPSGITAVYDIQESILTLGQSVIYLNGISDPGNLGTILRTALAFGFENVVMDETCVDVLNYKTINAAKDAFFKLNIIEDREVAWLKRTSLPIYAANSDGGVALAQFQPEAVFCLVLGSESHGVSEEILKLSQASVKIEISDQMESLNVAMAAGILLYALRRVV